MRANFEKVPSQPQPGNQGDKSMKPEEIESENKIVENKWEATLDGRKAASLFSKKWEVTDEQLAEARTRGLEIVPYSDSDLRGNDTPPDVVYVAQPGKFRDLLSSETRQSFRALGLGERLDKVLAEIGDKSIGEALVFLRQYQRSDREFDLGPYNGERPEIAVLTGIGLGYPACDVAYYVRTNYLGEERYPDEQHDPAWDHLLCPEHSRAELDRKKKEAK